MKRILLFASAIVGLFLTSCQQENLEPVAGNGQVTFTVEAPAALQTKAIADGLNVDELIYEVWITGATPNQDDLSQAVRLYQATTDMVQDGNRMKANITLDLVNDQNFTVLFWAQKKGIGVYNTDYLNAVTYTNLNAKAYAANDNRLDAFYSKAFVSDGATTTPTVTLRRPFAQVNLCTLNNKEAAQTPGDYNIALSQSKMRLDAVPTVFNVATSAATNYVAMEFAYHDVPSGDDQMITVNGKEYYYAGMNYVFAGANIALTYDIATKLNASVDANVNNTIANVPLKENHRTNIVGNLLTSKTDYEIVVDAAFDGEYYGPDFVQIPAYDEATKTWTITNRDELLYIAQQVNTGANYFVGQTVQVVNDIDLQGMAWDPIGHTTATAFNGMFEGVVVTRSSADYPTISNLVIENGYCSGFFGVLCNGGKVRNLNFSNVTISGERQLGVVAGQLYGNVDTPTIENVTVEYATITAVPAKDGDVYDNGDKIGGITGLIGQNAYIKDCTVKNSTFKAYRDMGGIVGCTQNGYASKLTGNAVDNVQFIVTEYYTPYADDTAAGAWGEIRGGTRQNSADVVEENKEVEAEIAAVIEIADGVAATEFEVNEETDEKEPVKYAVSNANGLAWVANAVNSDNTFNGKTIELVADINLEGIDFAPIGYNNNNKKYFEGTFDGKGYTIKNLKRTDLTYANKRAIGLFSQVKNATVKNLTMEDFVAATYGGEAAAIACEAVGDCTFENLTFKKGSVVSYNNDTAPVIGWANKGNFTLKDITVDSDVVIYSLWDSYDTTLGGVIGTLESPSTVSMENINVSCVLNAFNDVCANYQWYAYRRTGMVIGNMDETKTVDGRTTPDPAAAGVTCVNVVVNYGDWMNYHYCEFEANGEPSYADEGEWKFSRVEGQEWGRESYIDTDNCQHDTDESHNILLPVDQLFGGGQGVYGLREYAGVTVNYPASYRREVSNAAALTEALGKGVSVVLGNDVDFGTTQLAVTGENQVVDLGGHALTTANNWGGISLKNGATIKNGTITHAGNTAAIKAFNGSSVENVTINATCATADKTVTGIAVQQGANVESIKNVTINGVSQGIEVGYQATVGLIENAVVNESNNGTAKGIALVINGGKVGKAKDCTFKGETYGVTMHLKGVFNVGLELENCDVEGSTASIYAWDEKGISNTSGSLNLTYDAATTLTGDLVWDFEEECQSVITLNRPQ